MFKWISLICVSAMLITYLNYTLSALQDIINLQQSTTDQLEIILDQLVKNNVIDLDTYQLIINMRGK